MSNPTPTISPSPNPLWAAFPETSVIKRWAAEVATAVREQADANTWAEIGQAVFIVNYDTVRTESLMAAIAASAEVELVMVDVDGNVPDLDAIVGEQPVMVFLRPGEWLGGKISESGDVFDRPRCEDFDEKAARDFRRHLRSALESKWKGRAVIVVTAVESPEQIDPALRGPGLFDRKIRFPQLAREVWASLFVEKVGADRFAAEVHANLRRLGLILDNDFGWVAGEDFFRTCLVRRARHTGRAIDFRDITEIAIYQSESCEEFLLGSDEELWPIAVHEAGHALVAYLDSKDRAVPAYCTVVPTSDSMGCMYEAQDAHSKTVKSKTVFDTRHDVRTCLAGRAAEILLLGAANVLVPGASNDLLRATGLANDLVSNCGLPLFEADAPGSNLAVLLISNDTDTHRYATQVRAYLEQEFEAVTAILEENMATLKALANALLEKKVLVTEDMRAIFLAGAETTRAA